MRHFNLKELDSAELDRLCRRNPVFEESLLELCQEIFLQVRVGGDAALKSYTKKFDGVEIDTPEVPEEDFQRAFEEAPLNLRQALEQAAANLRTFHSAQQRADEVVCVAQGVTCWRAARPIESVGLYVPGGTAVLPSTVLMLAVPARLAGCSNVCLCVPPQSDGSVCRTVLAAAHLAEVDRVFAVGGAQAIAALTLGTETVPRVDKILGPGSRIVQTAKLVATLHGVSIDMVAGPSEVLIVADAAASPELVAADLLSQAEHGADSQAVLVTPSLKLCDEVILEIERQLVDLPRRDFARAALEGSFILTTETLKQAFRFSNRYAPEHLIVHVEDANDWVGKIQSAGSVFLGRWSPEVAGDYASGTNHTLPTSGMARSVSGVSWDSFVTKPTFQQLTPQGLRDLALTLETLAEVEQLEGHRRAVRRRLDQLAAEGL